MVSMTFRMTFVSSFFLLPSVLTVNRTCSYTIKLQQSKKVTTQQRIIPQIHNSVARFLGLAACNFNVSVHSYCSQPCFQLQWADISSEQDLAGEQCLESITLRARCVFFELVNTINEAGRIVNLKHNIRWIVMCLLNV